jgi:hypothetical protein
MKNQENEHTLNPVDELFLDEYYTETRQRVVAGVFH